MNLRTASRIIRGALAVSLVAASMIIGSTSVAQARNGSAKTEYQCAGSPDGLAESATLSMRLRAPSSVRPGQTVSIKGIATLRLGSRQSTLVRASLADSATLTSSTIGVRLTAGASTRDLYFNDLTSKPAQTADDYVASASIEMPGFVVPGDAKQVEVALPSTAATGNPAGTDPTNVVFVATVTPEGGSGRERTLGCWLAEGAKPATVTRIPVKGSPAAKPRDPRTPSPEPGTDPGDDPGSTTGNPGSDLNPTPGGVTPDGVTPDGTTPEGVTPDGAVDDPDVAAQGDVPSGPSTPTVDAAPEMTPAYAAIPPSTKLGGVVLPTWALVLAAALAPVLAIGFATFARRRLRRLSQAGSL